MTIKILRMTMINDIWHDLVDFKISVINETNIMNLFIFPRTETRYGKVIIQGIVNGANKCGRRRHF